MKALSEEKKEEIRELHKQGLNYRQIAAIQVYRRQAFQTCLKRGQHRSRTKY